MDSHGKTSFKLVDDGFGFFCNCVKNDCVDLAAHLCVPREDPDNTTAGGAEAYRKSGIDLIGDIPWGTHLCHFYRTKKELADILLPYFKAGLENNEFCLWIFFKPFDRKSAERALKKVVPGLDRYLKDGRMEIVAHSDWYLDGGHFKSHRVLQRWLSRLKKASDLGCDGMRTSGNMAWYDEADWGSIFRYEEKLSRELSSRRILAVCSYPLNEFGMNKGIDIIKSHQPVIVRRGNRMEIIKPGKCVTPAQEVCGASELPEANANPVCRISKDGGLLYVNPAGRMSIFGRHVNAGDKLSAGWVEVAGTVYAAGKKQIVELNSDGRIFLVFMVPFPGKEYINAYAIDITEYRKTAELLKESEGQFRALVDSTPDAYFLSDSHGRFIDGNNALEEISGYSKEEMLGKNPFLLKGLSPAAISQAFDILSQKGRGYPIGPKEVVLMRKDGWPVTLEIKTFPIRVRDEILTLTVGRDVSRQRAMETALKKFRMMMKEQKTALKEKNIALRQVLEQLEVEKRKMHDNEITNISKLFQPIVKKLKRDGVSSEIISLLDRNIKEITASFANDLSRRAADLSPREIEVANMIKNGFSSKEISRELNLSLQTVEGYRKNIRRKLSLSYQKRNLASYLQDF